MAKLSYVEIRDKARSIIAQHPQGIRHADLVDRIAAESPDTPVNTIYGAVYNLQVNFASEITKPARGLYMPAKKDAEPAPTQTPEPVSATRHDEADYYAPFADWLRAEDEVTEAGALGGSGMRAKWGTPDVVGIYRPSSTDIVKFPPEIVTAEIKTEVAGSVTGLGQALVYRLFSAKTYLVMPETIEDRVDDADRLEALCVLFGVGLVYFALDPVKPSFRRMVTALRFEPDMFYVNDFAHTLREHDAELFRRLFP